MVDSQYSHNLTFDSQLPFLNTVFADTNHTFQFKTAYFKNVGQFSSALKISGFQFFTQASLPYSIQTATEYL